MQRSCGYSSANACAKTDCNSDIKTNEEANSTTIAPPHRETYGKADPHTYAATNRCAYQSTHRNALYFSNKETNRIARGLSYVSAVYNVDGGSNCRPDKETFSLPDRVAHEWTNECSYNCTY